MEKSCIVIFFSLSFRSSYPFSKVHWYCLWRETKRSLFVVEKSCRELNDLYPKVFSAICDKSTMDDPESPFSLNKNEIYSLSSILLSLFLFLTVSRMYTYVCMYMNSVWTTPLMHTLLALDIISRIRNLLTYFPSDKRSTRQCWFCVI